MIGKGMSRYKFFWQGCKDCNAGVGLLISDRWIDRIIDVKRMNECIMCLKVLIGEKLITCICAIMCLKEIEVQRRNSFWDQLISLTGSIPALELIIV